MEDPLGLAGRQIELPKDQKVENKSASTRVFIRASKDATVEEKAAAVQEVLRAARLQRKWDNYGE
jgi:hypothetical protein